MDAYIQRCQPISWLLRTLLLSICTYSAVIAYAHGDTLATPSYTSIPAKYSGWIIYISYYDRWGGLSVNHALQFDTPDEACQSLLSDPAWGAGAYGQFGCVNAKAVPQAGNLYVGACSCADPNRPGTYQAVCPDGATMGMGSDGPVCLVPTPPVACTVLPLKDLPADDACAQALENLKTTQAQKDAACGTLTQALKDGKSCLADKLSSTPNSANPIPLKVTADIRDIAYQAHLREIWDKMEKLVELEDDPVQSVACATRRAEIAAEKGCDKAGPCKSEPDEVCYPESSTQRSHCLAGMPAMPTPNDAQHTQGNAFDASKTSTINPLQAVLSARNPPQTIQQFLNGPPSNCNLNWGGTFNDPVHFYAR